MHDSFQVDRKNIRTEEAIDLDMELVISMMGDVHRVDSLESKAAIMGRIGCYLSQRYDTLIDYNESRRAWNRMNPVVPHTDYTINLGDEEVTK